MSIEEVRAWLAAVGPLAATAGVIWAVITFRAGRADNARRDAAGLYAEMYEQAQNVPEDPRLPDEPGEWTDGEVVIKMHNAGPQAFYAVMASVWLPAQRRRVCGYADVIGPGQTLYAKVGYSAGAGCDGAGRASEDTDVRLTFRDSLRRGWQRQPDGILGKAPRRWVLASRTSTLWGRSCPAVGLHGLVEGETIVDWAGEEATISFFVPDASELDRDAKAAPPRVWTKSDLERFHLD